MQRLLVQTSDIQGETLEVRDPARLHHARTVLRLRAGDEVECLDGCGWRGQGRIVQITDSVLRVALRRQEHALQAPQPLLLGAALVRAARFEWLLEKATELGVDTIIPLVTARTVVRPSAEAALRQVQRWRRIVAAAARQCGRTWLPEVLEVAPYAQALRQQAAAFTLLPTLSLPGRPLHEVAAQARPGQSTLVLIGPEGDFTPEEAALAVAQGAVAVSLGALTLRSETAAVAALAVISACQARWA